MILGTGKQWPGVCL